MAGPLRQDRYGIVTVTTVWADERVYYPLHAEPYTPASHFAKGRNDPDFRAMAFKLIEAAQDRWRAVNAPHLVALVRAGATFLNGKLIERPGKEAQPEAA